MSYHSTPEVSQQVVCVSKVTVCPALGRAVPELLHNQQISPSDKTEENIQKR